MQNVPGDGNCFYHAVADSFNAQTGSHLSGENIRATLAQQILDMIDMSPDNIGAQATLNRWIDMAGAGTAENLVIQVVAAGTVEGWGGTNVFGILSEIMNIDIHIWDTVFGGRNMFLALLLIHLLFFKKNYRTTCKQ